MHASRFVLLAGATALAFFSGGYFDTSRAWSGLAAWLLVALALVVGGEAPPRSRAAWLAIGGLLAYAAWTLLSMTWAPIVGSAYRAGQLGFLYAGVLLAASLLLRDPRAQAIVEPALAAGVLIVIGYGISERLLPGLLQFARSVSAQGRLEQPLTYWNAMGELAALGFVLAARLAGDAERPRWLRASAVAAAAPLGLGLYLSFSRGALFACAAGLVSLIVLAPRRSQLEAIVICVIAGALASVAAAPFRGVTSLAGPLGTRETQGAVTLALLLAIAAAAAAVLGWRARRGPDTRLRLPRHAGWIALGLICAGLALAIVIGSKETAGVPLSGGASRLGTLQSNRYAYWRVAFRAFAAQPVHGVGAGGWAVWWLRYRPFNDFAQDAHSLPLQTLAELGLIGIALLAVFVAGVTLAARAGLRLSPALVAGAIAGLVAYVAHAPLDWDWQMPAVTLVAMVLAGLILASSEAPRSGGRSHRQRRVIGRESRAAEEPALNREA